VAGAREAAHPPEAELVGDRGLPDATVHPSSILRADADRREREYQELVHDLETVAKLV
jgi:hypothetical protein